MWLGSPVNWIYMAWIVTWLVDPERGPINFIHLVFSMQETKVIFDLIFKNFPWGAVDTSGCHCLGNNSDIIIARAAATVIINSRNGGEQSTGELLSMTRACSKLCAVLGAVESRVLGQLTPTSILSNQQNWQKHKEVHIKDNQRWPPHIPTLKNTNGIWGLLTWISGCVWSLLCIFNRRHHNQTYLWGWQMRWHSILFSFGVRAMNSVMQ